MTELTDQLDKIIQKAALDGALTNEAVAQFHTLVKERDALKDANDEWERNDKVMTKERDKLREQRDNMQKQILLHAKRESDLETREKEMQRLELLAEYEKKRVEDHQEMFRIVFRNAIIRKEVMTPNESHTEATGASHNSFSTKETLEEEEK